MKSIFAVFMLALMLATTAFASHVHHHPHVKHPKVHKHRS
jgi:hypothetical protein